MRRLRARHIAQAVVRGAQQCDKARAGVRGGGGGRSSDLQWAFRVGAVRAYGKCSRPVMSARQGLPWQGLPGWAGRLGRHVCARRRCALCAWQKKREAARSAGRMSKIRIEQAAPGVDKRAAADPDVADDRRDIVASLLRTTTVNYLTEHTSST
jgi:hypothetical protein